MEHLRLVRYFLINLWSLLSGLSRPDKGVSNKQLSGQQQQEQQERQQLQQQQQQQEQWRIPDF